MSSQANFLIKITVYAISYIVTIGIIISTFYLHGVENHSFPLLRIVTMSFASILLLKYFVYMLLSPWHDVWVRLRARINNIKNNPYYPRVSVIIPAWNEEVGLLETIKTLLNSTYKNLEIVVINDGSTDRSDKMFRDFIEEYSRIHRDEYERINIVYHYKKNGGKGAALNTGINLADGEIIVSIDADCVVLPQTISNFVQYFRDPKVMAAVGNVKIGNTDTLVGVVQYLEFLFSFYFKKADSLANVIYIIGGAAGAFRREVFDKIGFYSTDNITEDIELSVRIQDAGLKIVYASDAIVYTEGATEVGSLMKQRLRWKRGRFETFNSYKHMFFSFRGRHSKLLTWLILPLALFGEAQLFMELFFLIFLYAYSFMINDFSSFISGIIVVSSMFAVQIFFDDKKDKKLSFYLLAPIGWILFYLSSFVEYNALVKSIWGYYRNEEIKWQKWQRNGITSNV
ncbi:MAG: glycosyltransferase [Candidatus Yanofskybacteria bacterium]|nr:glycosyltransferase [Candidatus Yanofskybacteria bacterium]